jgi:amino acid transporter
VLFVYIFINVSVFLYFYRKERENFSVVRHALIPLVATAAVLLPIRGLLYPVPDPPYNLWPYLLLVWVVIGLVILFFISRRRPELIEALGHAFTEADADEPDHDAGGHQEAGGSRRRRRAPESARVARGWIGARKNARGIR